MKDGERKAKRIVLTVNNIDCATCAMTIERRLKKLEGIEEVGSAIMLNKVFVEYDESKVSSSLIMKAIKKAGYSSYVTRESALDSG